MLLVISITCYTRQKSNECSGNEWINLREIAGNRKDLESFTYKGWQQKRNKMRLWVQPNEKMIASFTDIGRSEMGGTFNCRHKILSGEINVKSYF